MRELTLEYITAKIHENKQNKRVLAHWELLKRHWERRHKQIPETN